MKKKIWILPLLLLATSCIHDDDDDCPVMQPSTHLYFSYLGDVGRDIFPSKIESVSLYVFDQNDKLVEQRVINHAQLSVYQGTQVSLHTGLYQVVCWGNVFANTTIIQQNDRLTGELSHPNYYTQQPIVGNDSLYYVYQKIYIPEPDPLVPDTLYFQGSHIKFRIYLHGAYLDETANPIRIRVNNLPPTYDFRMRNEHPLVTYLPNGGLEPNSNAFCYRFSTLRIVDDNPVTIDLMDATTGKPFYTLPLKDYMNKYGIHVNQKNEAIIPVHFSISSIGVSVLPWDNEDLKPEI